MYYTYVLHSIKDGQLYTGYTPNLKSRIKSHQDGYVTATKSRRPLILIYYESFIVESDAKRRELFLKGGNGKKELEKILKDYFKNNLWHK
ncbi:GIY-YIG nuclease family protein [Patescibacteria group bacterium]|nr:GIY-YIG nuclease family protein [Patescibacteria group bacterium]